jgi:hypothetical protein
MSSRQMRPSLRITLAMVALGASALGCGAPADGVNETRPGTTTIPAVTSPTEELMATAPYTGQPECRSELLQVSESTPQQWVWSADGQALYYTDARSGTWMVFGIEDGVSSECHAPTATPTITQPAILSRPTVLGIVPDLVSVSPQSDVLVYAMRSPTPNPPTAPSPGSEAAGVEVAYDIYLLGREAEAPVHVGQVDGDLFAFTWHPDGEWVLLSIVGPTSNGIWLWRVDPAARTLEPFAGPGSALYGVSPDGRWVLYRREGRVYVWGIQENAERELDIEIDLGLFWWSRNGHGLLFLSPYDETSSVVVRFDFDAWMSIGVSDTPIRVYPWWDAPAMMSPDEAQLAFIEDGDLGGSAGLRILLLCTASSAVP